MSDYILETRNVSKVYINGVYANKNVNFCLKHGEIHALVGENGAGKTTLMKMLYGLETPDSGEIFMEGKPVHITSSNKAIELGISMVHQHFMLIPSFSVAENIAIGYEPGKCGFYDAKGAGKRADELAAKYHFNVKSTDIVENLPVGLKQKVELLKALSHGAKVLILDEPTAVLTPQETVELFEQLRLLRNEGHTIIFISHKLKEVKQISDRITILRKGEVAGTLDNDDMVTEKKISEEMIGREISTERIEKKSYSGKTHIPVLEVSHLFYKNANGKEVVKDLNLVIRPGEIVGIAGVEGNGQNEFAQILGGMSRLSSGSVKIEGMEIKNKSISQIRHAGLVYIPADRMQYGVAGTAGIWENIISSKYNDKSIFPYGFMNKKKIGMLANQLIKNYEILAKSNDQQVGMLSGGNIQKVIVAREFTNSPKIIVAEQPTRGIDVGAAELIHKKLVELSSQGCAVIVISADLEEVIKVSDRIIVMYNGSFVGLFDDCDHVDEIEMGEYMLGVKKQAI